MTLANTTALGVDCNRHKVYCKITKLNKHIDKDFAMKLSNMIYRKAKKYKTDPMVSVAIAMQESSIRNINRHETAVNHYECYHLKICEPIKTISDVGIFQIHVNTAKHYDIDIHRLLTDIEYQVESHMKILSSKIKLCKRKGIKTVWSCYHSVTPKHRNKYVRMVGRYL